MQLAPPPQVTLGDPGGPETPPPRLPGHFPRRPRNIGEIVLRHWNEGIWVQVTRVTCSWETVPLLRSRALVS